MPPGCGRADLRRTPGRRWPDSRRPPPTASSPSPAGPPDRGPPPNSEGHVIMALPPYPASDFPDTPTAIVTGGASERGIGRGGRSEEHTSELQSRGQLVCRLL